MTSDVKPGRRNRKEEANAQTCNVGRKPSERYTRPPNMRQPRWYWRVGPATTSIHRQWAHAAYSVVKCDDRTVWAGNVSRRQKWSSWSRVYRYTQRCSRVTSRTQQHAVRSPPRADGKPQSLGTATSSEFLLALPFQTSGNGLETPLRKIILTSFLEWTRWFDLWLAFSILIYHLTGKRCAVIPWK